MPHTAFVLCPAQVGGQAVNSVQVLLPRPNFVALKLEALHPSLSAFNCNAILNLLKSKHPSDVIRTAVSVTSELERTCATTISHRINATQPEPRYTVLSAQQKSIKPLNKP